MPRSDAPDKTKCRRPWPRPMYSNLPPLPFPATESPGTVARIPACCAPTRFRCWQTAVPPGDFLPTTRKRNGRHFPPPTQRALPTAFSSHHLKRSVCPLPLSHTKNPGRKIPAGVLHRNSGQSHCFEFLQGSACTPLAYTGPLISAKSHAQVAAFCGLVKNKAKVFPFLFFLHTDLAGVF